MFPFAVPLAIVRNNLNIAYFRFQVKRSISSGRREDKNMFQQQEEQHNISYKRSLSQLRVNEPLHLDDQKSLQRSNSNLFLDVAMNDDHSIQSIVIANY